MSGTIERVSVISLAALAAWPLGGCGDDDNDDEIITEPDAGRDAGGIELDAATDAGVLACGAGPTPESCTGSSIQSIPLPACCAGADESACGLDVSALETVSGGLFSGCIETNQPFVPAGHPVSLSCTALWEQLDDMGDAGAAAGDAGVVDGFTFSAGGVAVSFEGCCRLNSAGQGECGFLANTILGTDLNFGCLPLENFESAFPSQAAFDQVKGLAVCDPATGEAVTGDAGVRDAGADAGDGG